MILLQPDRQTLIITETNLFYASQMYSQNALGIKK